MMGNKAFASEYKIWQNLLIILYGAIGLWLGLANDFLILPPLVLFWPTAIVLISFHAKSFGQAFFFGWLISFLGGCAALYWLYLPVSEVGGLPLGLAFMCAIFISAYISLQGGCFGWLCAYLKNISPICSLLAICLSWYLLEYCSGKLIGFPWLSLSGALSIWPIMIQAGSLMGAWLASSLWLIPCISLLFFFHEKQKKFIFISLASLLILLVYGMHALQTDSESGKNVQAIFLEGNINQNQKWLPSFQKWTLDLYIDLSRDALEEARARHIPQPLLIWPETSLPFFIEKNAALFNELRDSVKSFNAPLLFGAPGISPKNPSHGGEEEIFNRAYLMGPSGNLLGHYDKQHLVPFGEFLPQWLNWEFLQFLMQGVGIYEKGTDSSPLVYKGLALGMLICYEGIFPWLAQERVEKGANILVDISNDGWFGRTPAGRQHLYLTVARCVEQNRWLFRATNTGISAVIDNHGRIVQAGPQFTRGYMIASGKTLAKPTIYSKIAHYLPLTGLAMLCLLVFLGKNGEISQNNMSGKHFFH